MRDHGKSLDFLNVFTVVSHRPNSLLGREKSKKGRVFKSLFVFAEAA
jgi:hypothetical protein